MCIPKRYLIVTFSLVIHSYTITWGRGGEEEKRELEKKRTRNSVQEDWTLTHFGLTKTLEKASPFCVLALRTIFYFAHKWDYYATCYVLCTPSLYAIVMRHSWAPFGQRKGGGLAWDETKTSLYLPGCDSHWGRPALGKKMYRVAPGRKTQITSAHIEIKSGSVGRRERTNPVHSSIIVAAVEKESIMKENLTQIKLVFLLCR